MTLTHNSKLSEKVKVDQALTPTSLASTAGTGAYFDMSKYTHALFTFIAAAAADGKTIIGQIMQAKDRDALSAKVITNAAATIVACDGDDAATVTFSTILTTQAFTINDVVFTAEDTAPDADAGEFATGANDTAAAVNAIVVINQLLPKLIATSDAAVITVEAREPGEVVIEIKDTAATITEASLRSIALVEVMVDYLDLANDFTHLALRLTTNATIIVAGSLSRSGARFGPGQNVSASKTDVS